jgi:predicted transcriptional regulator
VAHEGKSDNNTHLMNDIAEVYLLLKGQYIDGQKTTFGSMFKNTRYAVILLVAITSEHFKEHTIVIKGIPFYNFYRLEKVADFLRLDYDRTRQSRKIYEDLQRKGNLKMIVTKENNTYVTLTEKGISECKKMIKDLRDLNGYLLRIPSLGNKYTIDQLPSRPPRDLQYKSHELTKEEAEVERLVKSISEWPEDI